MTPTAAEVRERHADALAAIDDQIAHETRQDRDRHAAALARIAADAEPIAEELREAYEQLWAIAEALKERLHEHHTRHTEAIEQARQFNARHSAGGTEPLTLRPPADTVAEALPRELRRLYHAARTSTRGAATELLHSAINAHL
jgi:hypothetical protein